MIRPPHAVTDGGSAGNATRAAAGDGPAHARGTRPGEIPRVKYPDAVAETVSTPHLVIDDEEIFDAHEGGKLSVELKSPLDTQRALSIAYTPGVAQVSRAIAGDHTLRQAVHLGQPPGRGGQRRHRGARPRRHRSRGVAAGDGGQERAVQDVRRPGLDPDRAGHQGPRRDRRDPDPAAPDVRRGQPRGHLGAALLRDRAPRHRGAGLPGHARRPARHRDRRAGRAAGRDQGARPRHARAAHRHLRCRSRGRGVREHPAGRGHRRHHRAGLQGHRAHRPRRPEPVQGRTGRADQPARAAPVGSPRRSTAPTCSWACRPAWCPRSSSRRWRRAASCSRCPTPIRRFTPTSPSKYAAVVATGRSDFPNQINNVLAFPGRVPRCAGRRRATDHREDEGGCRRGDLLRRR